MTTGSSSYVPAGHHQHDVRDAWVSVVLVPVAFGVAMLVGDALLSAMGYGSGETVSVGAAIAAGIPALLILLLPALAAYFYGRRAVREGHRAGLLPAWIGGAGAVVLLVLNMLAFTVGR